MGSFEAESPDATRVGQIPLGVSSRKRLEGKGRKGEDHKLQPGKAPRSGEPRHRHCGMAQPERTGGMQPTGSGETDTWLHSRCGNSSPAKMLASCPFGFLLELPIWCCSEAFSHVSGAHPLGSTTGHPGATDRKRRLSTEAGEERTGDSALQC